MKFEKLIKIVGWRPTAMVASGIIALFQVGCESFNMQDCSLKSPHQVVSDKGKHEQKSDTFLAEESFDENEGSFLESYAYDFDKEEAFLLEKKDSPEDIGIVRMPPTRPQWESKNEEDMHLFDKDLLADVEIEEFKALDRDIKKSTTTAYVVKSGDSLWKIAHKHGLTVDDLVNANAIKKDAVLKVGTQLVLPKKSFRKTQSEKDFDLKSYAYYTVQAGDTLSEIASRYHVKIDALRTANKLKNNTIFAGKQLIIPGVEQNIVDRTPINTSKTVATSHKTPSEGNYVVQPGESLSVLAQRFHVNVKDLMAWNNIEDARKLRAGQKIKVTQDGLPSIAGQLENKAARQENDLTEIFAELDKIYPQEAKKEAAETSELATIEDFDDLFNDDELFDPAEEIPVVSVSNI